MKLASLPMVALAWVTLVPAPALAQPAATPTTPAVVAPPPSGSAQLNAERTKFTDVSGKVYVKLDDAFHPLDGNGDAIGFDVISRVLAGGAVKPASKAGRTTDANGVRRDAAGILDDRLSDERRFDPKTMGFGPGLIVPTAAQAAEWFFGQNYRWKMDQAMGGARMTERGERENPADRQWSDWAASYRARDLTDVLTIDAWRRGIAEVLKGTSKSKYDVEQLPGHSSTAYTNRKTFDEQAPRAWSRLVDAAKSTRVVSAGPRALANGHVLARGIIKDASGTEIAKLRDDKILTPSGKPASAPEKAKITALFL